MNAGEATVWHDEEAEGASVPEFLFDPIGVLRRRWLWMLASLVLGATATAAVWASWTPRYVARATILITSQQIPPEFVRSTVREDTLANINAMIGKLLSAENLSNLIDQHGLFADVRDNVPRIDLVNRMRARIEASPETGQQRGTALVYGVSYQSESPAEAAGVANSLAALFVEASLTRRNLQARRTTDFLRRELESDEKELRDQSRLVSEFRREHRGELPDELDTNLRKLDMLAAHRESLTQQIQTKEDRIIALSSRQGEAETSEEELLLEELVKQLARESAANTDEHPNVIALRSRIARLRETLKEHPPRLSGNAKPIVDAERREIERLKQQLSQLETEVEDLNGRIDRTPGVGEKLAALEEKQQVLREDYVDSLRKVESAELAESLESAEQGSQVSILDSAAPPSAPTHPRWHVTVAGAGASLAMALGLALLLELLDPVVVGVRDLERLCEGPALGTIPYVA